MSRQAYMLPTTDILPTDKHVSLFHVASLPRQHLKRFWASHCLEMVPLPLSCKFIKIYLKIFTHLYLVLHRSLQVKIKQLKILYRMSLEWTPFFYFTDNNKVSWLWTHSDSLHSVYLPSSCHSSHTSPAPQRPIFTEIKHYGKSTFI